MRTFISILFISCLVLPAESQEKRVSLLFAGDAMQHLPQVKAAETHDGGYGYDSCFYLVKDKIQAADIAGVNFETTLGGRPYTGYPVFSTPDEFAFGLKEAGFDLFFMANNHAADRGRKGLERTIDILDSIGIKHTGTFKSKETRALHYPLMIIKNGIRIAFLNYSYDTNGLPVEEPNIVNTTDTSLIKHDLRFTQLYKPDIIIAQMHWGEEYHTSPSPNQKRLTNLLLRHGVQIIIGHHPHVVQPLAVEKEDGIIRSAVYYSLGNFISNQQKINTDGGMLAEIVLSKKDEHSPVVIESCGYSLVWGRKYNFNGKNYYVLIPSWTDKIPAMSMEEKQKMNIFVRNADKIIQ
jgi:Putative enzyme of poly-gamma-glutamate biosynthesis (capsule formation)